MRSLLLLALFPLLLACGTTPDSAREPDESTEKPASPVLAPPEIFCYKNIFPYTDGSGLKDVEEMTLIVMQGIVTGVLATVPAEKDSRKGKLTGIREDGVFNLSYVFFQEGVLDTGFIRVTLSEDAAHLSSEDPNFWVPKKINKVPCDQ